MVILDYPVIYPVTIFHLLTIVIVIVIVIVVVIVIVIVIFIVIVIVIVIVIFIVIVIAIVIVIVIDKRPYIDINYFSTAVLEYRRVSTRRMAPT
jgi:hypothetical protein